MNVPEGHDEPLRSSTPPARQGGVRLNRPRSLAPIIVGLAVIAGLTLAITRSWICDDAFISYRYARNLVEGHGLVFNAGERVEGMTNLAWTLWIAAGMMLKVAPATWSTVWSLACHAGMIALLGLLGWRWHRRLGREGLVLPVAALVAAIHPELAVWATSGLETAPFTFLVLLGFVLLTDDEPRTTAAGLVLAAAALTRPDGLLIAAICGAYLLARRPGRRLVLSFAVAFLAVYGMATVARVAYYGDYFPNTFYAKSAELAWWPQGLRYLELFIQQYWVTLLGIPLVLAARLRRRLPDPVMQDAALALAIVVGYSSYVARVGGDFMYARLLIPTVPFALTLLDVGVHAIAPRQLRILAPTAATLFVGAAMLTSPLPVAGRQWVDGIANEWDRYGGTGRTWDASTRTWYASDRRGATLQRYFDGLDVGVCFLGGEARLMYEGRVPLAVECETGLTDAFVAHQTLDTTRRRVGHKKLAPISYIIDERKLHFVFHPFSNKTLDLDRHVPDVRILLRGRDVESSVTGRVLHWDPDVMRVLAERGASFPDFPGGLDDILDRLAHLSPDRARFEANRLRRFYFNHVVDSRVARLP